MSNTANTAAKIIAAVLAVALIAGGIGIIYKYTNGFNEDFKTFYVEYDGKQILTTESKQTFEPNKPYRFDVKYTFADTADEPKDYTVKVMPYCTEDFEFTAGDKRYMYSKAKELTSAFGIDKHETYFELTVTEDMSLRNVLRTVYGTQEVIVPSDTDEKNEYVYSLVISSYNGNVTYNIRFKIDGISNNGDPITGGMDITDISIDPDGIVFTEASQ